MSNAMLLPHVTAYSIKGDPSRYAQCARIMGLADSGDSDDAACTKLLDELVALNKDLGVPSPKTFGIDEARYMEVLPVMAAQALASGSPGNNPRVPSAAEIEQIYRDVWDNN